ncbi:hypothetical protein F4861DRAFT_489639 [Xylaria intraflava]|nr:hypothetical protein F4861DRAFT_489639 [Xylaria intraflava]
MSPRCRRSARIASISKRQKESPAPQQLASVAEVNETLELSKIDSPTRIVDGTMSSPVPNPVTPSTTVPVKLPMSEMHPAKAHQTMAPPSSGLRNGFTDIDYSTTPVQSLIQNTPSKTPAPSSDFTFQFVRPGSNTKLGPDAQKIMDEIRGDVAKNKLELAEEHARDMAKQRELADGRKIMAAKGTKGRFSAAHQAEFKKLDSIEGHASSFRTGPRAAISATTSGKAITPVKAGIKRSQSNAGLDEPDSARPKTVHSRLPAKSASKNREPPESPSKRARQRIEDDVSALRPVSRDGSLIPQSKSYGNNSLQTGIPRSQTLNSLKTPTKSLLARTNSLKTPTTALGKSPSQPELQKANSFSVKVGKSLLRSPAKVDLELPAQSPGKKGFGGFNGWGMKNKSSAQDGIPTQVVTPGRFDRIKSVLKRRPAGTKGKSSIPLFSASAAKTPDRPGLTEKMFPAVPLTTPGRKQSRHVDFTPDTKQPAPEQDSPSPVKLSTPRTAPAPKLPALKFAAGSKAADNDPATDGEVTYPDLSAYEVDGDKPESPQASVPGTFTFRTDHTIRFDKTPTKGFGSAAGQASLRQVHKSTDSAIAMPGAFPGVPEASPNKENKDPLGRNSIPHGMTNKKRHRAEPDENEDDEGAKRGSKKSRKNPPAASGYALGAPKLPTQASPPKKIVRSTPQTPSPQKKRTGMRLSRLQMLAQPKIRK